MTFQETGTHLIDSPVSDLAAKPPGALPGGQFFDRCVRCGDCVTVCPPGALRADENGYPFLGAARKCGYCGLCADICMHGAIRFTTKTRAGFRIVLEAEKQSGDW